VTRGDIAGRASRRNLAQRRQHHRDGGTSPRGEIGFWRFLRFGAVITTLDLVLAFAILSAERAAGLLRMLGL